MSSIVISTTLNSMEKDLPGSEPTLKEEHGSALIGEEFHYQIAFKLMDRWATLKNKIRIESALREYITVSEVEYVPATVVPQEIMDDYYISNKPGLYPDLLKPIKENDNVALRGSIWQYFYVSVNVMEGIKGGEYPIKIILESESGEILAESEYKLEVIEEKIEGADIPLTDWMHYDCIADYYQVEVFSKKWYKQFDKFLEAYLKNGYNMLYIPLFTPPLDTEEGGERTTVQLVDVEYKDGKYEFNYNRLESFIDYVIGKGIKFLEFSHLYTQWGGKYCPKIIVRTKSGEEKKFGWKTESNSKEYRKFLKEFLIGLREVIERRGWKEKSYFHLTDEPKPEDANRYFECREAVKPYIGDMPIIDAVSHIEYYGNGLVDMVLPCVENVKTFTDKGIKTGCYYCCTPSYGNYSNRFLNMPLQRTRIIGMQLYKNEMKCFLHWGYNFYNSALSIRRIDPYRETDAGGKFPSGDSFIIYPDKEGVRETLRLKAMQEAFSDYGALKVLEKKKGKEYVNKLLSGEGVEGFTEYKRSAEWHAKFRYRINAEIKDGEHLM